MNPNPPADSVTKVKKKPHHLIHLCDALTSTRMNIFGPDILSFGTEGYEFKWRGGQLKAFVQLKKISSLFTHQEEMQDPGDPPSPPSSPPRRGRRTIPSLLSVDLSTRNKGVLQVAMMCQASVPHMYYLSCTIVRHICCRCDVNS